MKLKTLISAIFLSFLLSVTAFAATSDSVNMLQMYENIKTEYGMGYTAPFDARTKVEGIDESTGSVYVRETDLTVPGVNGLDFNLVRSFNSQSISANYEYNKNGFGKSQKKSQKAYRYKFTLPRETKERYIWIVFQRENGLLDSEYFYSYTASLSDCKYYEDKTVYISDIRPSNPSTVTITRDLTEPPKISWANLDWTSRTSKDRVKAIGYNWTMACPKMSLQYLYTKNGDDEYYGVFEDGEGNACTYEYSYSTTDKELYYAAMPDAKEYKIYYDRNKLSNITHEKGFDYLFRIVHKTGKTYYFSAAGKIQAISDKYNNFMIYTENAGNSYTVLDTMGRTISVTPEGCTVTDGDTTHSVSYAKEILYNPIDPGNQFSTDDTYVLTVTKSTSKNGITAQNEQTKYYMSKKEILATDSYAYQHLITNCYCLDKIEYPSGYTVEYDYDVYEKNFYYVTSKIRLYDDVYLAKERRTYENGSLKNKATYTYDIMGIGIPAPNCKDNYNFKNNHTVSFSDSGLTVYREFDAYGHKKKEITSCNGYKYEEGYSYKYSYKYASPITHILRKFYNGSAAHQLNTVYNYDDNFNLIEKTEGNTHEVFTYSDDYAIMLTKTANKDENTSVVTANTLTADNKSVACSTVTENGELKAKSEYSYDTYGNVSQEKRYTAADTFDTTDYAYSYDNGRISVATSASVADAEGNTSNVTASVVFDAFGNPVVKTDANGNTTQFEYDFFGRAIKQINPDSTYKTAQYNAADNYIIAADEVGRTFKYQYSPYGSLTDVYVKNGSDYELLEHNEYDSYQRNILCRKYRSASDYTDIVYTYDDAGRKTSQIIKNPSGTQISKVDYTYSYTTINGFAGLSVSAQMTGNSSDPRPVVETLYDYRNLPVSQTVSSGTAEITAADTYDYFGNPVSHTDGKGGVTEYSYDCFGNPLSVTDPGGVTVTNTYDLKGRLKTETDAQGNSTTYLYDAMDRQIDSTIAGPEGTFGGGTRYYYDGNGNVTKIIENVANENFESDSYFAHSKRFVYDSRNNLTCSYYSMAESLGFYMGAMYYTYNGAGDLVSRICNQDNPSAVNNNTAHTTSYEYDYMGRMVKETQPVGTVIDYSYDRAGNLLNKKVNGETALSYTYNYQNQPLTVTPASGGAVTYTYNGFGLVTGISNGGSALSYAYDSMLRPVTETYGDKALSYTYDNNGNVTSVKTTVGGAEKANVSYTYDAADRLTSVSDGQQYENYTYNNAGLLSAVTTPQTVTAYVYNPLRLPKSVVTTKNGETVSALNYAYLRNGNVQSISKGENEITEYEYNLFGALSREALYNIDSNNNYTCVSNTAYSYDNCFNLEHKTVSLNNDESREIIVYSYDENNRLLNAKNLIGNSIRETYTYDVYGNMTSKTAADNSYSGQFTYDSFGKMLTANVNGNTAIYTYDGTGMRRSKTVNGVVTDYIVDRGNVTGEIIGAQLTKYLHGSGVAARIAPGGDVTEYVRNAHGDVVSIINPSGTLNYEYDAFGNQKTDAADSNPFRYCGEYYDNETGFIYLRNRYYDPSIGRFTTEDPAKDGDNWYAYCGNNPVNAIDPWGLDAIVLTTSTSSVYFNAHTSVLVQDSSNVWYYFYWGNKNTVLLEVPSDKLTDLDTFNAWLIENGAGKAGEKTDKPLHDSSDNYTTATYIEGNFNDSIDYFLKQIRSANMTEEIRDGKHYYKNGTYDLTDKNCMTVSFEGLKKGILSDGTNLGAFAKFDGAGSIRPNDFRIMIRETFANQEFTKTNAKKSSIGSIGIKRPWYMSENYYNKGQIYGKMLRGY